MREIKFKAKLVYSDKWVYGFYVFDKIYGIHTINDGSGNYFHVDPDTVRQFTGLKDKNGLEIFEGDTVKGISFKEPISKKTKIDVIGIVYFSYDMGYFFNGNLRGGRTTPSLNSCLLISAN